MVHIFSLRSPEAFYRVIFLRLTFKVCQFLRLTAIGFKPYSGPRNWKKVKEKLNIACELKKNKKKRENGQENETVLLHLCVEIVHDITPTRK